MVSPCTWKHVQSSCKRSVSAFSFYVCAFLKWVLIWRILSEALVSRLDCMQFNFTSILRTFSSREKSRIHVSISDKAIEITRRIELLFFSSREVVERYLVYTGRQFMSCRFIERIKYYFCLTHLIVYNCYLKVKDYNQLWQYF